MLELIFGSLKEGIIITGFIFVIMMLIEYINVQTHGIWQRNISDKNWKQYLAGAFLGAIPGCLGAYTGVALYSHRLFSLGAVVTTMIATSGDEAFVMLAMFPGKAVFLTILLIITGIIAGYLTDRFIKTKKITHKLEHNEFPLHKEVKCECYNPKEFKSNLLNPSFNRIALISLIVLLLILVMTGVIMTDAKEWIKYTVIITGLFSLFVVFTVPEHFLKKHLWDHIFKVHLPKIFLWTYGTLLVINILLYYVDLQTFLHDNLVLVLLFAVLTGIIPESGPHLIFVTLFAQGKIPFSILLASSIAQDGHGMLPLLAESKRSFFLVKAINIAVALIVGFGLYFAENNLL